MFARRRPSMRGGAGSRPASSTAIRIWCMPAIARTNSSNGSRRHIRRHRRGRWRHQSTVKATRAASAEALGAASAPRLRATLAQGVTTVEIKSGYGLDTANEFKQLRVARQLGVTLDVDVRTTLLAAHALPPDSPAAPTTTSPTCARTPFLWPREKGSRTPSTRSARRSVSRRRRRLACSMPLARIIFLSSCTRTSFPTARARPWPPNTARCPPTISNTRAKPALPQWPGGNGRGTAAGCLLSLRETRRRRSMLCGRTACRSRSRPTAIPERPPRRRCR